MDRLHPTGRNHECLELRNERTEPMRDWHAYCGTAAQPPPPLPTALIEQMVKMTTDKLAQLLTAARATPPGESPEAAQEAVFRALLDATVYAHVATLTFKTEALQLDLPLSMRFLARTYHLMGSATAEFNSLGLDGT